MVLIWAVICSVALPVCEARFFPSAATTANPLPNSPARAGEFGKGFAVVAAEGKNLASQTGRATEQITAQINTIQSENQTVVEAIETISGTIREINKIGRASCRERG